jgi:hypothetical protein
MGVNIGRGAEVAVAQPELDLLHGRATVQQEACAGVPLCHKKDKSENPCAATDFGFVFILFPSIYPAKTGITRNAKK